MTNLPLVGDANDWGVSSIEITPADVLGAVHAGRAAGAAGTIVSWDLMHAPADGIRALEQAL